MTYAYSTDEENFYAAAGKTREDALAEGIESNGLEPGRAIWTGEIKREQASEFAPDMIDTMRERAYDDSGEWAEDWLANVNPEQESELTAAVRKVIDEWAEKHGLQPTFFSVQDVKAHSVPQPEPDASDSETKE